MIEQIKIHLLFMYCECESAHLLSIREELASRVLFEEAAS
jgi:hypothetical protein